MCRTGGRRCPGRSDPQHKQVENVRRRVTRNAAKANAARRDDAGLSERYDALVSQAITDLAVLDPDGSPPAERCPGCGQWVGARGHDCPTAARGAHSAQAIASAPPEQVTFDFIRRREAAQHFGTTYGQEIEPAGRYMTEVPDSSVFDEDLWERGNVTFRQPLHLDFGGGYADDDNWKQRLSGHYGGKTGDALSRAISDDGYDGIITHDKYGSSEIVDLTHLSDDDPQSAEKCPHCGQFAGQGHVCPEVGSDQQAEDGDEVASLGATPFRGVGRTPEEMVSDDPYFESAEYADFQEHLARLSAEHGVSVVDDQHALGLWEGEAEPASAIRVKGSREAIDALARDMSTRYQQDAVMVVRYDPDGPGSLHSYSLRHGDDPEEVVSALQQAGIPGARIVGNRLEIASDEKQPTMRSLVERFGDPEVHSISLDFIEKDENDSTRAPFAGMSPGSAPGEGATWGTVKGTRDGLERRHPGVELSLRESSGGYVVLSSIKVPEDEQRSGTGTKVMEDLIAEADKNGWKMALTPDTSFGATSKARLERFYRRFGFVPNKGRNKDFATMEGMVRQPRA